VVGKILTEKRDQVVIDVGYTVLVIPRNDIEKISRGDSAIRTPKPSASSKSAPVMETKPVAP